MDMNAQSIRNVQFREKVRGYHPSDVDAFVSAVAETVERLERQAKEAASELAELSSRTSANSEAEDSLRRTLVLAQRTADAAVQEAREEAARVMAEAEEERAAALAEVAELRQRLQSEAEQEGSSMRQHLEEQRAALQADVKALGDHLERERERLRIYFEDQLRRLVEGEPGMVAAPEMQADPASSEPTTSGDSAAGDSPPFDVPGGDGNDAGGPVVFDQGDPDMSSPQAQEHMPTGEAPSDAGRSTSGDDDPFLAELRRAVNDEEPLGPRDHDPEPSSDEGGERDFDMFVKGDDTSGRFGSRFRRQR